MESSVHRRDSRMAGAQAGEGKVGRSCFVGTASVLQGWMVWWLHNSVSAPNATEFALTWVR